MPLPSRRGPIVKALLALALAGGLAGGWKVLADHPDWLQQITAVIGQATDALQKSKTTPPTEALKDAKSETSAAAKPLASSDIATPPGASAGEAIPNPQAAVAAPTAAPSSVPTAEAQPAETLSPDKEVPPLPPQRTLNDPLEKKAQSAGLSPDLSHALLKRLTETDYRNASVAVTRALTETADGQVFTWPTELKKASALFEVHFVRGSAADCRRYVVTITKDRWSTTAPPMEKCGIKAPQQRHAATSPKLPSSSKKEPRLAGGARVSNSQDENP